MSVIGKAWRTPLERMRVRGGRAKITDVPILATGIWKGTVVNEKNIDEVVAFQKEEGPIHVVTDHMEDVRDWVGLAFNYRKHKHPNGYFEILADLEITDDELIKKLKYAKEQGGGFCGISPRIEWGKRDEEGNIEGLSTPHVSVVIHPAQGWVTKMSETYVSAYLDLAKDIPPTKCKCPKCSNVVDKARGNPCQSVKCPKCGTKMVGHWPKEDKSMAGVIKMTLADLKKGMPKLCPKCKKFVPEGATKCPHCGGKLSDYSIVRCPSCDAIFDFEKVQDEKCPNCGAELGELEIIIPFAAVGENEDVVIPKLMLGEIDDILKNPNVEAEAMRGFFERLRENLKKKKKEPEEEEPDEEDEEDPEKEIKGKEKKKPKKPEPGTDDDQKDKEIKCPECGEMIPADSKKCPKCKAEIKKEYPEGYPDPKKQTAYAIPAKEEAEKVKEHVYSKELLRVGTFRHPDGYGLIPLDRSFMQKLKENTSKFFDKGVPCYIGHPDVGKEPADKIVGWLTDIQLDKTLKGKVSVTNQLVHDRIDEGTLKDASVGIALHWLDAEGNDVAPIITHLAITTTPYIRKLEEFQKLAASKTDTEVQVMEEVEGDPLGLKLIHEEIAEIKAKHEKEMGEITSKYEKFMEKDIQERRDKVMGRVDRLIESELVKPGIRDRFEEFAKKTQGTMFDEKRSVPEEILEILEVGLVKGEVLTQRQTADTTKTHEYLSLEDLEKFKGRISRFEREGIIALDAKGRAYWAEGRPEE